VVAGHPLRRPRRLLDPSDRVAARVSPSLLAVTLSVHDRLPVPDGVLVPVAGRVSVADTRTRDNGFGDVPRRHLGLL
jgi:hypothetical protein